MLTSARNDLLTRVGPGTPMGELLRRYWQPIGGASQLETNPVKPIGDITLDDGRAARCGCRCSFQPLSPPTEVEFTRARGMVH